MPTALGVQLPQAALVLRTDPAAARQPMCRLCAEDAGAYWRQVIIAKPPSDQVKGL